MAFGAGSNKPNRYDGSLFTVFVGPCPAFDLIKPMNETPGSSFVWSITWNYVLGNKPLRELENSYESLALAESFNLLRRSS
jgi:hypothetical protein